MGQAAGGVAAGQGVSPLAGGGAEDACKARCRPRFGRDCCRESGVSAGFVGMRKVK